MLDKAALRALFPVTRNVVYFNHAAVGPLSVRAYEAMEQHARDQREYGATHWRDWYAEHDRARDSAAALLGCAAAEVAILKNTSEGLSFVAEGLAWERGDNVVTTALEFPSNWTPWKRLESRGVEVRVASQPDAGTIEPLLDARTRLVTVSSVAFHNGVAADVESIGALCASRDILFCVDAIQSLGALPIDVRKSRVSFLAADGHKWLCGPEGAAVFFVAEEHRDKLRPVESGWTNIDRKGKFIACDIELLPDARRFEAGSLNTNGIYGLRAAIDLLRELGIENVAAEVIRLATRLADGLESIGFQLATPRPIRSGIIGVTPPGVDSNVIRLHRLLDERGIICAPREGLLRFSPHVYNSDEEVDRVVAALRELSERR